MNKKTLSKTPKLIQQIIPPNEAAQQKQPMLNTTIEPNTHNEHAQFIHEMDFCKNDKILIVKSQGARFPQSRSGGLNTL